MNFIFPFSRSYTLWLGSTLLDSGVSVFYWVVLASRYGPIFSYWSVYRKVLVWNFC